MMSNAALNIAFRAVCCSSESGMTDQELAALAKVGDRRAFDILLLKYEQKIKKLIGKYVRNPSDIEDVSQDVFLRAYGAINRFRGDSAFYTWLYRIAVNTSKNYLDALNKRAATESLDLRDEEGHPDLSGSNNPLHELLAEERLHRIEYNYSTLPSDLREAYELRENDGLSYEEIAHNVRCPVGTVRSRIFRAREAMAEDGGTGGAAAPSVSRYTPLVHR